MRNDKTLAERTRTIGAWTVTWGEEDFGREVMGEDGYYWQPRVQGFVTATHERGKIFCPCWEDEKTVDQAEQFVADLADDFDPASEDSGWYFWRTVYGSEDWGFDDELAMMSDEERQRFMRR